MRLGIFAKTFQRPSLTGVLDAVLEHGFGVMQFNMACAGLPALPDQIPLTLAEQIGRESRKRQLETVAVSATFNMIHPDRETRREGFRRLEVIAARAHAMNTGTLTLCTGTRNPDDMWRGHEDNSSDAAWQDLIEGMERALEVAERFDVQLGIEPETHNVVGTPDRALQLQAHLGSERVRFILDPANLYRPGDLPDANGTLERSVDALASQLVMAHAKDLTATGEVAAPGRGAVDFPRYLKRLQAAGFQGPLVMHGLHEHEVPEARDFLQAQLGTNLRAKLGTNPQAKLDANPQAKLDANPQAKLDTKQTRDAEGGQR